jgi:type I restriction enzyme S subunit
MNAELLLAHFDGISDAPDAVPRLRRFVLDLAVRGKLVEQDPKDEPAVELIRRIQTEKRRLAKEGKIDGQKPLLLIENSALPFDPSKGWAWVRLGELAKLVTSGSRDWAKYYSTDGALFLRMGNLSRDSYRLRMSNMQHVKPPEGGEGSRTRLEGGDLLISITGEVGLLGLIPPNLGEAYINQHTCLVRLMAQLDNQYLAQVFCSPFGQAQFDEPQRGLKNSFRLSDVTHFMVPLPPLDEQHRIVAKVDELMALCDRLEAAQRERESRRDQLAASTHHHLNNGADAEALSTHAQFFIGHLPRLTARPDQIKQLRQTILNLAVHGKLVPQDPKDEPADNLLKRIRARGIRGKTKSRKNETTSFLLLEIQEAPFQGPPNWAWVQLREIGETQTGATPPSGNPELFGDYIPFVKPANLDGGAISLTEDGISKAGIEYSRLIMRSSVLMVCIGATLGKAAITDRDVCCNQQINAITPYLPEMASFTLVALRSSYFQKLAWLKAGVGTLPIISKGKWEQLPVPVPPLAEQHRIVAEVDELMALCDQLESHLTTAQTEAARLLESVLHHALKLPA